MIFAKRLRCLVVTIGDDAHAGSSHPDTARAGISDDGDDSDALFFPL
jgi:hypothetical protein